MGRGVLTCYGGTEIKPDAPTKLELILFDFKLNFITTTMKWSLSWSILYSPTHSPYERHILLSEQHLHEGAPCGILHTRTQTQETQFIIIVT